MRPLLLLSNDDGVQAPGLRFLIEALRPIADLFVMAPDGARSGQSRAITAHHPLYYHVVAEEPSLTICSCTGTPVDCVKMALDQAMTTKPNLVVGGINHGDNSAINAHYSGTMGVVCEGAIQGFPSIAFSLCDHSLKADFSPLKPYLPMMVEKALEVNMPPLTCLNVNFPKAQTFRGIKVCRMAYTRWVGEFERRTHPLGQPYYWMVGDTINQAPDDTSTDRWALDNGYIAVTPTTLDCSCPVLIEKFEQLLQTK